MDGARTFCTGHILPGTVGSKIIPDRLSDNWLPLRRRGKQFGSVIGSNGSNPASAANRRAPSSSLAFHLEDKAIIRPDFDVVILNESLGAHHGFTIVPANEVFNLDAPAAFRDPA